MSCSYSGALSMSFSREVRSVMRDPTYQQIFKTRLDPDSQSVEQWMTTAGGGLVAAGVGGAITGKGAHILVIDDPVKNREDADSETARNNTWDWYTSTAYTRLAPGGGVLVIQTRWHDDDLAGRLITAMDEGGDEFEIVNYSAIAEEDEEFRLAGEALHPERYDVDALNRIRRAVGERDWNALYQGNPVSDEGAYFQRDWFEFYDLNELPSADELTYYTAWDLAIGTKEENDFTVGITVALDRLDNLWVVDMQRGKWDGMHIVDKIIDTWEQFKSQITGLERGRADLTRRNRSNPALCLELLLLLKVLAVLKGLVTLVRQPVEVACFFGLDGLACVLCAHAPATQRSVSSAHRRHDLPRLQCLIKGSPLDFLDVLDGLLVDLVLL